MADRVELARRFYAAIEARDLDFRDGLLAPDFVGEVAAGMPLGMGGRHDGPRAMIEDVWLVIGRAYEDMRCDAEGFLRVDDGRVVVLGHYRGVQRATGHRVEAAFAHVLTMREAAITRLVQITDTVQWTAAAVS